MNIEKETQNNHSKSKIKDNKTLPGATKRKYKQRRKIFIIICSIDASLVKNYTTTTLYLLERLP